ncbi:MAG TPA: DUF2721 domain-containing protein [Pseudolabrys sp.]|nr:DUF2721 domain-containing protein [Pseudolabrys sp.]
MLNELITADKLSLVISQAAAPAFLLGAIASFLSVLVSHMSRIADRLHAMNAMADDAQKAQSHALWSSLHFRAILVHRAIYWAVGSGISTCLLMIVAFASAYFGARHEPAAALLFTLALGLFTASLISFAREVRMALNERNPS